MMCAAMSNDNQTIHRDCRVCGTTIKVDVAEDGRYEGGHYFGEVTVPVREDDGEFENVGERDGHDVVRWTGEEATFEYWECANCFR